MKKEKETRGRECLYGWADLKKVGNSFIISVPKTVKIRKKQSSISSMGAQWAKYNAPKRKFKTKRIGNTVMVTRVK